MGTISPAESLIEQRINETRRALWWSDLIRNALFFTIVAMGVVLLWVVIDQWVYSPGVGVRTLAFLASVGWGVWFLIGRFLPILTSRVTPEYAARSLERDLPELKQQLTSYVTLRPDTQASGLRRRVVNVLGARAAGKLQAYDALPAEATGTFRWWIAAAAVMAILLGYVVLSPKSTLASATRLIAPFASISPARRVTITDVQPGDAKAMAGRSVELSAKLKGLRADEAVTCRVNYGNREDELELELNSETGLHQAKLELPHTASGVVGYQILGGDAAAGPFRLDVENVPVIAVDSIHYEPPTYTGEKPYSSSSPSISAIDGTTVTLNVKVNRPVVRAEVQFNPKWVGEAVRASAGTLPLEIAEDGVTLTAQTTLRTTRGRTSAVQLESYRVRVWDENEQSNPDPIVYPINVVADLPPEVSIVVPRKSPVNLAVNGQQIIEVHAMDADFALSKVMLDIRRGTKRIDQPTLWAVGEDAKTPQERLAAGKGNRVVEYRFRPKKHGLVPGEIVTITALATDNRIIPGDSSVRANVGKTDPVEIRIVPNDDNLPNDPSSNDGRSRPDDRPASDAEPDKENSAKQDSGNSGSDASDQSQNGKGDPSGSKSGDSDQGDGQNQNGNGTPSDSKGDNEPSNGSGSSSQPSDPSDGETGMDSNPGQPSSENPNPNASRKPGDPANPQAGDSSPSRSGEPTDDSTGKQPPSDSSASGGNSAADNQDGNQNENQSPPEHDAEAFERIKDYIEQKQKEKEASKSRSQESDSQQQASDQSGTGEPETGRSGQNDSASRPQEKPSPDSKSAQQETNKNPKEDPPGSSNSESQNGESQNGDSQNGDSQSPDQADSQSPENSTGAEKHPDNKSGGGSDPDKKNQDARPGDQPQGKPGDQPHGKSGDQPQSKNGDEPNRDATKLPNEDPSGSSNDQAEKPSGDPSDDRSQSEPGEGPDKNRNSQGKPGDQPQGQPGDQPQGKPGDQPQGNSGDQPQDNPSDSPNGQSENTSREKPGQSPPGNSDDSAQPRNNPNSKDSKPGKPNSDASSGESSKSPRADGESDSLSGRGSGQGSGAESDDSEMPPPADLDYTRKATDMVLDYLDEQRDVDQDLLDELQWSKDDLQRFRDRWKNVQEIQNNQPTESLDPEVQDALRSLGLRKDKSAAGPRTDAADNLRSIRDSGNRRPAPAAFRDVFENFRRRK